MITAHYRGSRFRRLRVAVPLSILVLLAAFAAPKADAASDPTYEALRAARLDGRQVTVQNLVIERDAFRFQFDSGALHLLEPVDGQTLGAVFVGKGNFRLTPSSPWERNHLAFLTGKENLEGLNDTFDQLVLLFTDDTNEEISLHAEVREGGVDDRAAKVLEAQLTELRKGFELNFHLRLLEDLLNGPGAGDGVFYAFLDGKDLPPALAMVDSRGSQASRLIDGGEDTAFVVIEGTKQGFWYVSDRATELDEARRGPAYQPLARALHYRIDTSIERNVDVVGTTTILFQTDAPGVRCLGLELLRELRVSEAQLRLEGEAEWTAIAFIQEHKEEDGQLAVVFPDALAEGTTAELRLRYAGEEVMADQGEGNYAVGARTSWYPNLGIFTAPATFELTYRVPAGNEVISVGLQQTTRTEGEKEVSFWRANEPIRVAGFNYGRFKKLEQRDEENGVDLQVFTNPGTPDIIHEINRAMRTSQEDPNVLAAQAEFLDPSEISMGDVGKVSTEKLAQTAMADGLNAVRIATAYFGPMTQKHVAITQQSQWGFGQSWPSLIFMPYISFMNSRQRATLGMAGATDAINSVGYHEMAHQWWGHEVGWRSYRDQWLSEGFASFTACLALELVEGEIAADECWEGERDTIVEKPRGQTASYKVGPITQGYRLNTHKSQVAAQRLIYPKGAFVVHMLRMMMRDERSPNPDAAFIAMMTDFVKSYGGRSPSTEDFKEVVNRHIVPELDPTRTGTVDWFFDQWVYGTQVPKLESQLKAKKAGKDEYQISGEISLTEVSEDFLALVPIYVEFVGGQRAKVGVLPFRGAGTQQVDVKLPLPKKPKKVTVNARHELLARD